MIESKTYNDGCLIVGKVSGDIESQSIINEIFWQIDSINVGEVKDGFSQLFYESNVQAVSISEDDIARFEEINTGMGINVDRFRTALVLRHPEIIRLARIHQLQAKKRGFEVEIFNSLEDGFAWLGQHNPEPAVIRL